MADVTKDCKNPNLLPIFFLLWAGPPGCQYNADVWSQGLIIWDYSLDGMGKIISNVLVRLYLFVINDLPSSLSTYIDLWEICCEIL